MKAVFVLALLLGNLQLWAQEDGRAIMEGVRSQHQLADEERLVTMTLIDRRGKEKERKVRMWNRKADGLEKVMLVFLEPRDVKGTGLLTWEQKDREDDQWLYLPSTKREKRIAASGKRNKFMGTDFTFEDLSAENLERHNYKITGEEELEGVACYVIEAVAASENDKKDSGYAKRVLWVRKDILYTVKIAYYDQRDTLFKELLNGQAKLIEGTAWRSDEFTMKDLRTEHETRMKVEERKVAQGLDDAWFSLNKLRSF